MKIGVVRLSFADGLFELQKTQSGSLQWQCSLLIPKSMDRAALEANALDAAVQEWGDKAKGWLKDEVIKNPFLDGDGKQGISKKTGERHPGYEGHWFIRCNSGEAYRPKLVDRQVLPITSKDQLYSGCYVNAVVACYTWDNKEQGKGLTFGISMVQFVRDGDRLGGGGAGNPEEYFEKIPDEGNAPAETKTGKGAGGLFG
jgi:hypothetical protein